MSSFGSLSKRFGVEPSTRSSSLVPIKPKKQSTLASKVSTASIRRTRRVSPSPASNLSTTSTRKLSASSSTPVIHFQDYASSDSSSRLTIPSIPVHHQLKNLNLEIITPTITSTCDGKRALCGLRNLGNTCFMNSVLQCLNNIPLLAHYFLGQQHLNELNLHSATKGKLASVFGSLVENLWNGTPNTAIKPENLKNVLGQFAERFLGYDQQDAQEFLRFLLDGMHEDLNRILKKPPYYEIKDRNDVSDKEVAAEYWKYYHDRNSSALSDLFCGQIRSQVICAKCGHRSVCFDVFWDLSVPLPKTTRKFASFGKKTVIDLNDCLAAYTSEEKMTDEKAYFCSKCKTHRPVSKTLSVYKLPKILVLHLKRFSFDSFRREKVTAPVAFKDTELSLEACYAADAELNKSVSYDLVGVVNHMGNINGGHYTADCFNSETQEWYNYNDANVTLVDKPRTESSSAYILFYQQRDSK